jgi:hypothetical protein
MKKKFPLLIGFLALTSTFSLFGIAQKAEAASCTFPGNVAVSPGQSVLLTNQAVNFSRGYKFLTQNISGNFTPFGFAFQALPGFAPTGTNKTYGFIGRSTTLYTSFSVLPTIPIGSQATVTEKIIDVTGRTLCQGTFTITVQ